MMKALKIGNIPIIPLKESVSKTYLDQSEQIIFDFFDKPQSQKWDQIYEIVNSDPPWTVLYHLTPQRRHLLDWYEFGKGKTLLDIGSGCGALTGLFSEKLKSVTCLELTDIRAKIIAKRWADKKNIRIFCGSLEEFNINEKFDYVNFTGVLEYAGMFAKDSNSLDNFTDMPKKLLEKAKRFLNKKGKVIIAIENPLGIRYLSGAVEDHYSELFIGVENYPDYNGIRTFTKKELTDMLLDIGFEDVNFYFPLPDYKLPVLVIHEDYLKKFNSNALSSFMQTIEYSHNPLFKFYSEVLFAYQLRKEGILERFMNSFLVIATKK